MALNVYSRIRITQNLLPLLSAAAQAGGFARVVTMAGGTKDAKIDLADLPAVNMPIASLRGHVNGIVSVSHFAFSSNYPEVAFVQYYPGTVKTALTDAVATYLGPAAASMMDTSIDVGESGQRTVYVSTSAAYPPLKKGTYEGLPLVEGVGVAKGLDGKAGSGIYLLDSNGEAAREDYVNTLDDYRKDGTMERVLEHIREEFERINKTGEA